MVKFSGSLKDQAIIKALILKNYNPNLGLKEIHENICKEHYIWIGNVSKQLKRLNLPFKEIRGGKSILTFNPFEFGDINNEYWFGFFLADGHVGKNKRDGIFLHNTEIDFLRTFHLHCKVKIGEYIKKTKNKPILTLFFGDKNVKDYINNLGVISDKRYGFNINFPITMPLLRGIFDGDGSVRVRSNSIEWKITSGSIQLLNALRKFIKEQGLETSLIKKKKAWDMYILGKNEEKINFLEKLYEQGDYFLLYKFIKVSSYISQEIYENRVNCWKALRAKLTTTYPEMENVNV